MNKFTTALFAFLLALVLPLQAKEYKYQTVPGDLMKTRIYTLDNGLTVYLSVNNEKPRIQTYIAVRTGSRNDPPETTGLAHYLEHLMFKGTRQFGTTDATAEAPLLDSIQNRFKVYRTLKDSLQRRAYYHLIDSISQLAAKYFIPNEYDKLMSSILPPDRQHIATGGKILHPQRVRQADVVNRSAGNQRLHEQRRDLLR